MLWCMVRYQMLCYLGRCRAVTISEMTEKMRAYFERCTETTTPDGRTKPRAQREIASLAGLAMELGIFKDELVAMEGGTEEQRLFFKDMIQRYEVCVDQMYSAGTIDKDAYKALKTQMFALTSKGEDTNRNITLVFPEWHAPDDWEKYKEFRTLIEEHELSWYQAYDLLEEAIEGLKKHGD